MKHLTHNNYQQRIQVLLEGIKRFESNPEMGGAVAGYAEAIGNIYREFEPEKAATWFRQSLEGLRSRFGEPSMRAAFLYWKLGELDSLGSELNAILERWNAHDASNAGAEAQDASNAERIHREHEMLVALFVMGAYQDVVKKVDDMLSLNEESPPFIKHALRFMSMGLIARESTTFDEGMEILKTHLEEWPTSGSNLHTDLFRFGLDLRTRVFA